MKEKAIQNMDTGVKSKERENINELRLFV